MAETKFTVIVPSYNGGEYFKQCVASVLAQSYTDFELAVLDNCSADGSAEWLASLGDPRIKVYSSPIPLPIEENWARAVEIPKNEFITFFGHDDLMDPNYLEVMNGLIREYSDAGLYHAHFRFIDREGSAINHRWSLPARQTGPEYLKAFMTWQIDANGTGYVMRSDIYDALGGIPHFKNLLYADHALWILLTQKSYKVTAPQECFSYRVHPASASASSGWQAHFEALTQYMDFLLHRDDWNRDTRRIFEQYAPDYFFKLYSDWYAVAMVQATKKNKRLEPQVFQEFAEALSRIAPDKVGELTKTKSALLRQFINSNPLTRLAYIGYILARYGRGHLPAPSKT